MSDNIHMNKPVDIEEIAECAERGEDIPVHFCTNYCLIVPQENTQHEPILVYLFHEAPAEFKALSKHGGDEDWLAIIPPHLAGAYIGWMESGTSFGYCAVSEYPHPGRPGYLIRIGCHS